jgi:hypothetical protein
MPGITALGKSKQEDCMFEASLVHIARPYLKKKKKKDFAYTFGTVTLF